ncbi:electron transport complex subunit E [Romboutsia sp. CE17]|uniref:electron transport complex subunit RsxE n=1 Tax=Romboutsia sp. CE17 TaxID=2724150 RepID=UPI001442A9DA|nr:electron transport complex subunit E [Romboutsia sp. CE17]QJA07944.1 electron transport complex subunit E [Romboutsia sp. CE17]
MNSSKILKNGLIDENPTFVQVIGMCPTLAVTSSAINGLGMGLSTALVLLCSNAVISMMRKIIPDKIRIPAFVVVIATFVTIVGLLLKAYVPTLDQALGLYIPLIVVNCIILARAESFASKNGAIASALDGIGMGLGFTLALTILGSVREIFGAGTLFGLSLFGASYQPALLFILPPGAFLTLGFLMAGFNKIRSRKA